MPMTLETIETAFAEYRKTVTVVDKPANFDSFSQGYIAGWNAHETHQSTYTEYCMNEKCPRGGKPVEIVR